MLYSSEHTSWMHSVNPAMKLGAMILGMAVILFIHNVNVLLVLTGLLTGLLFLTSGHPANRVALFLLPFLFVFISTGMSMVLFGQGDTLWWQWGPVNISRESFFRGLHVALRALCFGMMGLLFALTTRPVLLFYSLMQQLKLPPRYAYGFMASLRLLPLILQEFKTLRRAYKVRGVQFRSNGRGLVQRMKMYAIPLLAQSIRRAQRIAVSMEARQFNRQGDRTYYYQTGFSGMDALMLFSWIGIFTIAWWIGWHFPFVEITDVRF
ncbi:energy-coupling factor transporter transmembrane component T family protein [Fodinibius salsisoli]|uniref:Energy-coupling factor transporter transmembrane protein EcfT n=1 Tax=Fodinibius salsisoli TaxID=2820877 RepID=A0ABT3PNE0_9BACT|nr:energy-coupling factor transporter transmembrane component T [Fodinibius salsisoli]MCW9706959.1 energy-coupling factor transporter transmembrane protein EcfT [Fodinibius salsisoli]